MATIKGVRQRIGWGRARRENAMEELLAADEHFRIAEELAEDLATDPEPDCETTMCIVYLDDVAQGDPYATAELARAAAETVSQANPDSLVYYQCECGPKVVIQQAAEPSEDPLDPDDTNPDPPVDPPDPGTSNLLWERDFSGMSAAELDAELAGGRAAGWDSDVHKRSRMTLDGVGLKYNYPAQPANCSDYTIGLNPWLPEEVSEVTMVATVRFEPFWDTVNSAGSCSSNPDHKLMGLRVRNFGGGTSGASRFGLLAGNGFNRRLIYSVPNLVGGENIEVFAGLDARSVLWDGQDHQVTVYGKVSSAEDVADGAGGVWLDGALLDYDTGLVVNRRGIYSVYMGRNLNQGPAVAQGFWWRNVKVYEGLPAAFPTS